jgi:hypothetical protein
MSGFMLAFLTILAAIFFEHIFEMIKKLSELRLCLSLRKDLQCRQDCKAYFELKFTPGGMG